MQKKTEYFRKGKIIRRADLANFGDLGCESINEAKRESRKIQLDADGALGRGTLQVADVLPTYKAIKEQQHA